VGTTDLSEEDVSEAWAETRDRLIPSTEILLQHSISSLGLSNATRADAYVRFGDYLQALMREGLRLLRLRQEIARREFMARMIQATGAELSARVEGELISGDTPTTKAAKILEVVAEQVSRLPPFVLSIPQKSLDQQTKKRAGVHMERSMAFLFDRCQLPYEQQTPKRSDFVFPDSASWVQTPELAVLVSAKHTLAERWKQLLAERTETGRNAYLVTLELLTAEKAATLLRHRFVIYMPAAYLEQLPSNPALRDLNSLPEMIARVIA
jgi:hypothetical protein